ncbi:MAG TPA: methyltransferase domain-containing protein [Bacillota bacterium]|nr:methyltransferase domain-containing protein [Bacillota bacterium]
MAWDEELFARIGGDYDLVFAGEVAHTQAQADFAAHACGLRPGQRVLDVCCGPGRHAVALALRGLSVTGVDRDPHLLEVARERARSRGVGVHWVRGDVRHLPRLGVFHAAICLFASWGYAADPAHDELILAGVARRLRPGGHFLVDVPNLLWLLAHPSGEELSVAGGVAVREIRRFDPASRQLSARWQVRQPGRPPWQIQAHCRVYGLEDLEWMLARAGLVLEAAYGEFDGTPLTAQRPRCLALARRPILPAQ